MSGLWLLNGRQWTLNGRRWGLHIVEAVRPRGDDGGSFWKRESERWLEEYLAKAKVIAKKPRRVRVVEALDFLQEVQATEQQFPVADFSVLTGILDKIASGAKVAVPYIDEALQAAIAERQERIAEEQRRAQRRRRDWEALRVLEWGLVYDTR